MDLSEAPKVVQHLDHRTAHSRKTSLNAYELYIERESLEIGGSAVATQFYFKDTAGKKPSEFNLSQKIAAVGYLAAIIMFD